jgi:Fic family protein
VADPISDQEMSGSATSWPAHHTEMRDWIPLRRYRKISRRRPTRIAVSIPPLISDLAYAPAGVVARANESAAVAVARLEAAFGEYMAQLAEFLTRTEASNSSDIDAGWRAFGNALAGGKAAEESRLQLAGVRALIALVEPATHGPITLAALLNAHRLLMEPDQDAQTPGALRAAQSWVGGEGSTPIDAVYVPAPPEMVPTLVDDLLIFANRSDLPILAHAAIAHAQFLSIHPFADGNHRIGRALANAILRRRGVTRRTAVPLLSALRTDTDRYFALLSSYRRGDIDAFVEYFSTAALRASDAAEQSVARLTALPQRWLDIARPRANSSEETLINTLLKTPVFNADTARQITGTGNAAIYRTLERLTEVGILDVVSAAGATNPVWGARQVLTELDTLPLLTGVQSAPVPPRPLDSVMLLSSRRFRL